MDGNPKRIKKDAFSKRSGYVWTGSMSSVDFSNIFQQFKILDKNSVIGFICREKVGKVKVFQVF